jgi:hypothetical protein
MTSRDLGVDFDVALHGSGLGPPGNLTGARLGEDLGADAGLDYAAMRCYVKLV